MSEFKYIQKIDDLESTYSDDLSSVYLKLDSKNKVFKFRYRTSKEELNPIMEVIGDYIQDENVDDLLGFYSKNLINIFGTKTELKSPADKLNIDYCLNLTKSALRTYIGKIEFEKTHDLDLNEIICRCAKVDKSMFIEAFLSAKGRKKELIQATNMTSFCGGCASLVEQTFCELETEYKFLAGEKIDFWVSKIITMTKEFHVQENDELDINATRVDIPNVQIVVNSFNTDKISRADISKNLTHLFDRSLPFRTEIQISFIKD
jgi:hypothetical protein